MTQLETGTELIRCVATRANMPFCQSLQQGCLGSQEPATSHQHQHVQQYQPGWHQANSLVHVRLARTMPPFPKAACRSKPPPHNPPTLHVLPFRDHLQEMRDATTPDQLRYALPKYVNLLPSSATERLLQLPRIMALLQQNLHAHTVTPQPTFGHEPAASAALPPATSLSQLASAVSAASSTADIASIHSMATSILASLPTLTARDSTRPSLAVSSPKQTNTSTAKPRTLSPDDNLDICRDLFERSITLLDTSLHLFSPQQLASCLKSIGHLHTMSLRSQPELRISDRIHAILVDGSGAELRSAGPSAIVDVMQGLSQLGVTEAGHWHPVLAACSVVSPKKWSQGQTSQIRDSLTWVSA